MIGCSDSRGLESLEPLCTSFHTASYVLSSHHDCTKQFSDLRTSVSLGRLVETHIAGPQSQSFSFRRLGLGLDILHLFPGNADAACQETTL